jgi:hypothetical protein
MAEEQENPLADMIPLAAISYVSIVADCRYHIPDGKPLKSKYLLPDLAGLSGKKAIADLSLSWHEEGIEAYVEIYRQMEPTDQVDLFFDTRDVKTSGWNTRFCHHFFFRSDDGFSAGEITHFRTEDRHELCHAEDLQLKVHVMKNSYTMQIFIPNHCLFGYDPTQFQRLGFNYQIRCADGTTQNFSASPEDFSIEQQPSLWSSLKLI